MSSPREIFVDYPLQGRVKCPRCWANEDAGARIKGDFCDPAHLSKHLKAKHPGDALNYKCALCDFRGSGKYPLKSMKSHYERVHASPRVDAPGPSTRGISGSVGECATAGVRTRAVSASTRSKGAVGGADRRRAAESRQPRLSLTATPSPGPSTAPRMEARRTPTQSPSYAAVTAGDAVARRASPIDAGARGTTAATCAAPPMTGRTTRAATAAATRRKEPPTTAASGECRMLSRVMGNAASRRAGAPAGRRSDKRTPPRISPLARAPSLPQTTRGSPSGTPGETTTTVSPATSLPTTLTTCTVTTTTCGGPVMSTGHPAGREHTPPCPSPLWAIREASPCAAVIILSSDGERTPSPPPARQATLQPAEGVRQRLRGVAHTPSDCEGDEGGAWRVSLGRRATRRRSSDSPTGSVPLPAARRHSPTGTTPTASANLRVIDSPRGGVDNNNNKSTTARETPPPVSGTTTGAASCRGSSPEDREGGDTRDGTEQVGAVHPCAPVNVRGVMGRRRAAASIVPPREEGGASSSPVGRHEGGRQHHGRRRADVPVGQPLRGPPAPATVARQRRRERVTVRDALVGRAADVATIADLETFATSVSAFFGEDAAERAGGAVPRAQDRPVRSREAGVRRGARGGVRPEGEGASGPGPAPAGPGASGEARGDWVREAKRLQALYRTNRRRAVREVLQGPADLCQVPRRRVQEYFERLHCGEEDLAGAGVEAERADPSSADEEYAYLLDPFTEREVDRRLRRMTNSAPGPDGVTYRDLRGADPGTRLLTANFNACLRLEAVPASWKTSSTLLVHKKGDRGMLESWRPLALGDTIPKLFAALLADRLTDWSVAHGRLSPTQKGFLRDEGCYEHNFVLQEILTNARRTRRQAVVAWLDLSNAFGSVPHAAIRRALAGAAVPRGLIAIWDSMYDGCTTRVRTADGYTAPIPIRSGVRQGCPLSPIIFNLAIDSVLRAATELDVGYALHGHFWSALAYADDIALLSETPEGMQRLLGAVEAEAAAVGLRFNPAKCATLHIGAGNGGRVLPTPFRIQGQPVRCLADGEPYTHLGIPTGYSVEQTPYAAVGDIVSDLRAVDGSLLAPWQKLEVCATFILPRLDFLLRGAKVQKSPLKAADITIRRIAKSWLNLPQRASAEGVYMPPRWGGCGLLPLSDLADVLSVAHVFRMLTAGDAAVRELAWESLRGVVGRRIGQAPSCEDIAAFLSGSLEGRLRGGGEDSLWSRARNAARRQSERLSLRWRWVGATEEMVLECRGPRGAAIKIPPGARGQVVGRLRSAVAEHYAGTLLAKPDQGKVFEVSSRCRVSNHFIRGGSFTRFADWRFVHKARLDVLPLNGARRWEEGDKRCRRCGEVSETLPHVLCHCGVHSAAIQLRHNAVLHRLWKACRLPGDIRVNQRIERIDGELGGLRPDLVIRHEPSKSVVICDVTVPFENRWNAFEDARARKIAKYEPLAEELQRKGYRVVVTAFVVGALGSWDPRNEAVLKVLRVGGPYASMMRRLMVSDAIRWSRDIYVEHVSGIRQYLAPPRPFGDAVLATPPRAVRRRWLADEMETRRTAVA